MHPEQALADARSRIDRHYAHLDFDPDDVPISPAATVILLDDRPDLRVLMLRRTSKVVFAPDNWVFPGGRVDPEDHLEDFNTVCHGLGDEQASSILGVPKGGLAWWLASCRETLEEAGLLLVTDTKGVDIARLRDTVRHDEGVFIDQLLLHKLAIDAAAVEEVARFITPLGSPRRFDARFFVARAPDGQEPTHDDGEIVEWEWIRPDRALNRWRAGEFPMMSPTVRMLSCLLPHRSAHSVLEMARRRLPPQQVRVGDPAGEYRVLLPGEAGYEEASANVEFGWVRLWDPHPDTSTILDSSGSQT